MIHALFFVNYILVALGRGLYTPFMCWYFYTFPIVEYFAGIPYTYLFGIWGIHEFTFRFFKDLEFEMMATYIWLLTNAFIIAKTFANYSTNSGLTVDADKTTKHD
jgi:hypothetical protein